MADSFNGSVAPFTGAWIEINLSSMSHIPVIVSHPSRVRGLKYTHSYYPRGKHNVAPFTGAWIEIETNAANSARALRRTLHGCVD